MSASYNAKCPCGSRLRYKDCCGFVAWKWEAAAATGHRVAADVGGDPVTHDAAVRSLGMDRRVKGIRCPRCGGDLRARVEQFCPSHLFVAVECATCRWHEVLQDDTDGGHGPVTASERARARADRRARRASDVDAGEGKIPPG